jgi:hypothetical protein
MDDEYLTIFVTPYFSWIAFGISEVVLKQEVGWSYIKAGF